MTDQIHSCSYYCHIPACIKAQRDELRDKFVANSATHRVVSFKELEDIAFDIAMEDGLKSETYLKLRAIIDNKEQS